VRVVDGDGARKTEVFSLSFLDVNRVRFGAVVLFYTILSAQAGMQREKRNDDLQAEVDRWRRSADGYKNLVVLRTRSRAPTRPCRRGLATDHRRDRAATAELAEPRRTRSRSASHRAAQAGLKSLEEATAD